MADRVGHPELLLQPERHRLEERREGAREGGDVGGEDPLELHQRLVVEADVVDVVDGDTPLTEHVPDCVAGEAAVVLLAGEPLLRRRGDDLPVAQEAGGRIVIEG